MAQMTNQRRRMLVVMAAIQPSRVHRGLAELMVIR
jgi:hypothetical protein